MDLKIKDVAELLSVSETTIRRWLQGGKIPAYKLNRQYRFSRIEIENWMMEQRLTTTGSSELMPASGEEQIYPQPGNQQFSLYRALNRGGLISNAAGDTKEEVIRGVMPHIAEKLRLDPDVLGELLLDRERLMPTAFNNGVAVPHTRECLQKVPFDLITIVLPEQFIEYGALDEKPVDVMFFLFATGDKIHLHLLAKLAHLSSDEAFMQFLRTRPEKNAILERVREWEKSLSAP